MKINKCIECLKEFPDPNFIKELPLADRVYCNECLDILIKNGN